MTAGVRERVWSVMVDWFEPEPDRSILMTWPDDRLPGGQDFRTLGTPRHTLVEYGGVFLARRDPDPDVTSCLDAGDESAPLAQAAERPTLIVDCETTGLDDQAEIVWIAALTIVGTVALDLMCRPTARVEPKAARVHKIDPRRLASAPAFPEVYREIVAALADRELVAWNASFDSRLWAQTCARYQLPQATTRWACLLERYEAWRGLRCQLATACHLEKVNARPTHGALDDAWAALALFRRMAGLEPLPQPAR